jgi:hypothetical protein
METVKITEEKIEKLITLYDNFKKAEEEASNELSKAMMNKNRRIKYKNENLEESVLWEEIRYSGQNGEANKILKEKYPLMFEKAESQEKTKAEYKEYCIKEIEIDPTRLTLSDIIKLTLALVDYKLKK